jgi:hypothetical protein
MGGPIRLAVPVSRREGSSIVCKQESERNARRRMNHLTGVVVARYLALFLVFAPGCLGAGDRAQGTSLRNATHSEARRDVSGALRHQHRLERNVRETYVDHAGQTRAFVEHPEPVISAITRYDYLPTRECRTEVDPVCQPSAPHSVDPRPSPVRWRRPPTGRQEPKLGHCEAQHLDSSGGRDWQGTCCCSGA